MIVTLKDKEGCKACFTTATNSVQETLRWLQRNLPSTVDGDYLEIKREPIKQKEPRNNI